MKADIPTTGRATPAFGSRSRTIALLVAGAFFMENLDGTVIVTAMPQMAASFGVHPIDLNVGLSAYLLTLAVLMPASGWMADRFGARLIFAIAIVIFTVASVLCGLCQNLTAFTLARILQGTGGAMMVPVGRLAVLRATSKHELVNAIAVITWPGLAAPVLGPPLGGFITTYASWHWIFFLNVPLGLIALPFAVRLIPPRADEAPRPFDGIGFVLIGVACFTVMYGVELVGRGGASWPLASLWVLGGIVAGTLAVLYGKRAAHPLVDLRALSVRSYATTIRGGSLSRIAIASIPFLLPLLFQVGFGLSAFASGLLLLAVFAGNLMMKPFTTPIVRRFSFRAILITSGLLNAALMFSYALLTPASPTAVVIVLLFAGGLTRSLQFTALITLAFAEVPTERMSGANTLLNIAQQMSMGMGIALGAVALRVAGLFGTNASGGILLSDFRVAFVIVGVIALISIFDALTLSRTAGDAVRVRK